METCALSQSAFQFGTTPFYFLRHGEIGLGGLLPAVDHAGLNPVLLGEIGHLLLLE